MTPAMRILKEAGMSNLVLEGRKECENCPGIHFHMEYTFCPLCGARMQTVTVKECNFSRALEIVIREMIQEKVKPIIDSVSNVARLIVELQEEFLEPGSEEYRFAGEALEALREIEEGY